MLKRICVQMSEFESVRARFLGGGIQVCVCNYLYVSVREFLSVYVYISD